MFFKPEADVAFAHQAVKDLAWITQAPMISQSVDLNRWWKPNVTDLLNQLNQNPAPLIEVLANCKSHFLGSYFEVLFSFAIRHLSLLKIILEHQQITDAGRTLGEVDLLVLDPDGEVHQFEIAIKFYLQVKAQQEEHWIGPNKNDSLAKKTHRAWAHQLQVLQTQAGHEMLLSVNIDPAHNEIQHHLMIFGYRYFQYQREDNEGGERSLTNNVWMRLSELKALAPHIQWMMALIKPYWIASPIDVDVKKSTPMLCFTQLEKTFEVDPRPQHFLMSCDNSQGTESFKRVFIVPNSW